VLKPPVFQKTKVIRPVENDMVQEFDPYDLSGGFELCSDLNVAGRRFHASGRMVVGDDDGAGSIGQCVSVDLSRMYGTAIDEADRHHSDIQNLVRPVDRGTQEMFLLAVGVVADMWQHVGGSLDL